MGRTLTLPDDLEKALEAHLQRHDASVEEVLRAALRDYLEKSDLATRLTQAGLEFRLPTQPLEYFTVASDGSGKGDISAEHDKYLSEP
jgi:plasmid stability protein